MCAMINNENMPVEDYDTLEYGKEALDNTRELIIGKGKGVIYMTSEGSRWGARTFEEAPAWIKTDGTFKFKGVNGETIIDEDGLNIDAVDLDTGMPIRDWRNTIFFRSIDFNTVGWDSNGKIILSDGTTFTLLAGDTGNMGDATVYVYFDKAVSTSRLQTTTSAIDSVGRDKILVCTCKKVPNLTGKEKAKFKVFGGDGRGVFITAGEIAANTITANEITANAIGASELDANAITTNHLTGVVIQGNTIRGGIFESNNRLGKIYTDTSGDIYIQGSDDIILIAGGAQRVRVVNTGLIPNTDFGQDLGRETTSAKRWGKIFGKTFYGGRTGTQGADLVYGSLGGLKNSGTVGFITSIDMNGCNLRARFREMRVNGGIFTGVSDESGWFVMDTLRKNCG